ncbi:MAG: ferrochelatase [Candidatus Kariarchaeaceae archaeon]|jgi:ferrochelatase
MASLVDPKKKFGIVFFNMGGPENLESVRPFLYNLFSDNEIINLPWFISPFQKQLAWLIAKFRSKSTQAMYKSIGGRSYTNDITQELADEVNTVLDKKGIQNKSVIAMRYAPPRVESAILQLEKENVDTLVLFTQYPHYAKSTTGSSYNDFYKHLEGTSLEKKEKIVIEDWGTEPAYIDWWVNAIKRVVNKLDHTIDENVHILFTAHGLPMKYIKAGEEYPIRIEQAMNSIVEKLGSIGKDVTTHLAYQSKAGPFPWTQPYTHDKLEEISKTDPKTVIMVPLGFVSNNVETLYEIDILYSDLAQELGINDYRRVQVPDQDSEYANSIADMLHKYIEGA